MECIVVCIIYASKHYGGSQQHVGAGMIMCIVDVHQQLKVVCHALCMCTKYIKSCVKPNLAALVSELLA